MGSFSLGTIWEQTVAFLRQENGLLVPVALAIYGPAQLMLDVGLTAAMAARSAQPALPSEALLVLPGALLLLFGNLAIARIVLTPGISVAEALAGATRRVGPALGAMLMLFAVVLAVGLAIIVAATMGAMIFGADPKSPALAMQLSALVIVPMIVLWVRMLMLPAVLAKEEQGVMAALRRAWALSRGQGARFVGVILLTTFLGIVVAMIEQFVVGSLIGLAKLATGEDQIFVLLGTVLNAGIEALLAMAVAVYLALIYRALVSG